MLDSSYNRSHDTTVDSGSDSSLSPKTNTNFDLEPVQSHSLSYA